jgi:hypothetical protein
MTEWRYSTTIPSKRIETLLEPSSIEEIANRISEEMEILCCHFDNCKDHATFGRVVYCIRVTEDLFDLFFNSPHGYRGAYFRSPGDGMNANAIFIDTLTPKLLAKYNSADPTDDLTWVRESLGAVSAKAWLAENGLHLCPKCEGEWGHQSDSAPEIINGRWECGDSGAKRNGRKAPCLTKIRIFGAFLDGSHNEFIPWRKRHRANDIHCWGWS